MKFTKLSILAIAAIAFSTGAKAACDIPPGTYNYIMSDGYQTFYFKDNTTIRVDASGGRIVQNGNFNVKVAGQTYARAGNQFSFINPTGTYTKNLTGPIYYSKGPFSQQIGMLPVGTRYDGELGAYTKQADGKVIFSPYNQLPPIVITDAECGGTTHSYNYDEVYKNLGVKKEGNNLIVNLGSDILFDYDKADITPQAAELLQQVAYLIQQDRKGKVVLRGHTDSKGSDSYNLNLSKRRAHSVAQWLTGNGISNNVILVKGYGEAYPVQPNENPDGTDNPQGREMNRRVEILIQTVEGEAVPEPVTIIKAVPAPTPVYSPMTPNTTVLQNSQGETTVIQNDGVKNIINHPNGRIIEYMDGTTVLEGPNGTVVTKNKNQQNFK